MPTTPVIDLDRGRVGATLFGKIIKNKLDIILPIASAKSK